MSKLPTNGCAIRWSSCTCRALGTVDSLLDRTAGGGITTVDLLDQLLTAELAVRRERNI